MIINSLSSSRGVVWIKEAYQIYKQNALLWTLVTFGIFFVPVVLGKILPLSGSLLGDYVQTLLGLGIYRLCKTSKQKEPFDIKLLFNDFSDSNVCLSILWLKGVTYLGLLFIVGVVVILDIFLGVTSKDVMSLVQIINSKTLYLIPDSFFIILGINLSLIVTWLMFGGAALAFASPLIAFQKKGVLTALKLSLAANFKNIGPFSMLFLAAIPLLILCVLTAGIGFLVVAPIFSIALVLAYEDIFSEVAPLPSENTSGF